MKGYYIREATKADIPKIAELEKLCFPDPWTLEMFESEFNNPLVRYFVAELESDDESGNEIVGQFGFLCVAGECHINNVAVHPDYRKDGIGSELLELVLNITEDEGVSYWTLETRVTNNPAIGLYQKYGFEIVGERPNYYDDGTSANLMTREKYE